MADEAQVNSSPESDEDERNGDPTANIKSEYTLDQRKAIGAEVDRKYTAWREPRRVHELQWFI